MRFLIAILMLLVATTAHAFTAEKPLKDPAQEARARALFSDIRCVTCISQSVKDSDAELAVAIRKLIRTQIAEGKNEAEIKQFLAERYGEQVLLDTPLNTGTYLLWAGPGIFIFFGLILLL